MIFLCAHTPCIYKIFGESYYLEPLTYPHINLSHILIVEDTLGERILKRNEHIRKIKFDTSRIPGFPERLQLPPSELPQGSKIILLRGGGIGDLIMLTPAIRALREALPPHSQIILATSRDKQSLFEKDSLIDCIISHPIRMSDFMEADYFVDFTANDTLFASGHMTDFYLARCHIDYRKVADKVPWISRKLGSSKSAAGIFEGIRRNHKGAIVLLSGEASDIIRTVPTRVLRIFPESFDEILFIVPQKSGDTKNVECGEYVNTGNVFFLDTFSSLTDFVSAIQACDAVISSDSAAYHIAAALEKPCLAIFGPVHSSGRALYYPTVHPVDAVYNGACCSSPCGIDTLSNLKKLSGIDKTGFNWDMYDPAKGCPEANLKGTLHSPCILSFSQSELINRFKELIIGVPCL
ncbi:hypothetical protein KA005_66870 [bacterium]|nr:hypothetical protein [bacterium]